MEHRVEFLPIQKAYSVARTNGEGASQDKEMYEIYCRKFDKEVFEKALKKLCTAHPMLLAKTDIHEGFQIIDFGEDIKPDYIEPDRRYVEAGAELESIKDELFNNALSANRILEKVVAVLYQDGSATILTLTDGIGIDGESQEIMIRDLIDLYEGKDISPEYDFSDFAKDYVERLTSNEEAAKVFWNEKALSKPEGYRPSCEEEEGTSDIITLREYLPKETTDRLNKLAGDNHISFYSLLLSLYLRVLDRYTDQKSFAISTPRSIRDYEHDGIENTIGMLTDFIPMIANIGEGDTLLDTASYVQDYLWQIFDLGESSGVDALRILQANLQIQMSLKWTFTLVSEAEVNSTLFERKGSKVETGTADAEMLLMDSEEGTELIFVIRPGEVNVRIGSKIIKHYVELLDDIACEKLKLTEAYIPLYSADEEAIQSANSTDELNVYEGLSLSEAIKKGIDKNPGATAIIADNVTYTYKELDSEVTRLANVLSARKKQGTDRIAIFMEKSPEQIITALAAVYAKVTYMPLETTLPLEDISWCIEKSDIKLIIASEALCENVKDLGCAVVSFDELKRDSLCMEPSCSESCYKDDIAIIINTSGTTGRPKSVLIKEKGLVNCIVDSPNRFEITDGKSLRAIAVTNFCHDMALYDYLGVLHLGGSVVIPEDSMVKDPKYLLELIGRYGVNFWNSVPAIIEMLLLVDNKELLYNIGFLKRVVLGGDWVRCNTVQNIKGYSEDALVFSVGGPTETTIWNIYHKVTDMDLTGGFIPYGKPLANTGYHIFDKYERECPVGIPGTMYVEGIGVTEGYAKADDENAEHYLTVDDRKMFRSGDKGVRLEDGSIKFLGREDNQVKINGKRIELGGIERKANEIDGVSLNCCVLNDSNKRISLFYEGTATEDYVRKQLEEKLVSYMLPSHMVKLDKIPLNHNGKADRKLLKKYKFAENKVADDDSSLEGAVLTFLKEILGIGAASIEDNFYYLGGDSVSAMQLISKLYHKFHVEIDIYDILGSPAIADWIPIIKEKINEIENHSKSLLTICREFFGNEKITDDMSFTEMGGNESNLHEFSKLIGLSDFQVLSLPWIDHWERLLEGV
ncbi:non-ribosomal peptide synthetase [Butyrivibrio sp. LB2008]|uniref:non-ribosomal peptide synthetase n=1 Tax=Butyrivibrio sp. LB2008 TaxID=1408305 RepID=UPI00047C6D07|nr:non-ribosomal peptide synthetase [Butyrivibrio sp. LB2008]